MLIDVCARRERRGLPSLLVIGRPLSGLSAFRRNRWEQGLLRQCDATRCRRPAPLGACCSVWASARSPKTHRAGCETGDGEGRRTQPSWKKRPDGERRPRDRDQLLDECRANRDDSSPIHRKDRAAICNRDEPVPQTFVLPTCGCPRDGPPSLQLALAYAPDPGLGPAASGCRTSMGPFPRPWAFCSATSSTVALVAVGGLALAWTVLSRHARPPTAPGCSPIPACSPHGLLDLLRVRRGLARERSGAVASGAHGRGSMHGYSRMAGAVAAVGRGRIRRHRTSATRPAPRRALPAPARSGC